MTKKDKCKHPIKYRQAVNHQGYGIAIVCILCKEYEYILEMNEYE